MCVICNGEYKWKKEYDIYSPWTSAFFYFYFSTMEIDMPLVQACTTLAIISQCKILRIATIVIFDKFAEYKLYV